MSVIITPLDTRTNPAPTSVLQDAVAGETYLIPNAGTVLILIQTQEDVNMTVAVNTGAATRPASKRFPSQTVADIVQAVPANSFQILGPFGRAHTNAQGQLQITIDAVSGVKLGAIRVA